MVAVAQTNSYQSGSFASGGSFQTSTGLNIAAGVDVLILIMGLTDNAGTLTSPTLTGSVASGTNPTLSPWTGIATPSNGWYSPTAAWGNWMPFVGVYTTTTTDAITDFRVTFDTTDAIYGASITIHQLSAFGGISTQFGLHNAAGANDNVTVNLDDGSGSILSDSLNLVAIACDANPGAVELGSGNTELFEATTGITAFVHADPTPGTTIDWGALTATVSGAIGVAISLLNGAPGPRPVADVSFGGISARGAGTTTVALSYPSGVTAEHLAVACRCVKPDTATAAAETGWTAAANNTGGTGTQGLDTGPQRIKMDYRVLDGSETGSVTFDQGSSPNAVTGVMVRYSKDPRFRWDLDWVTGSDNSHGTARSMTAGSTMDLKPGDVVLVAVASDTDATTAYTSPAITASGFTFGTTTERLGAGGTNTGQDAGLMIYEAMVLTGAGSATCVMTLSGGPSSCGPAAFMRLRQVPKPYVGRFSV